MRTTPDRRAGAVAFRSTRQGRTGSITLDVSSRRLVAWLGPILFTLACLLSASRANAQATGMWVSSKKPAKSTPSATVAKPAAGNDSAARADTGAVTGSDTPADSAAIRMEERLEHLERTAQEQTSVIGVLLARLEGVMRPDSLVAKSAADAPPAAPADAVSARAVVASASPAKDSVAKAPAPTLEELSKSVEVMTSYIDSLKKEIVAVDQRSAQRVSGLGNFRFSGDVRMRYEQTSQAGGTVTRQRERTRARFHMTGATGGDLSGGLSIATGSFDEPATENQTHTGFFTRKTMAFERFFINYKPSAVPGLSLTAGKFPTPWTRTPLTVSNDLYPEGVAGSYRTGIHNSHIEDVSVVGFWLPMLEVSGGPDSYLNGGQLQTKFRFDARTKAAASVAVIKAVGQDAIATAAAAGTFKPSWPTSNSLRTDSTGKVLGYAHGFQLQDFIVSAERAFAPAWPVSVSANAVRNTMAARGDRMGFFGEVKVGTTSGAGRAQFGYTFYRIERDAVISAFNVTDVRLGTNSIGHIAQASWKLRGDLTAGVTGYFGRVLDPTKTPGLVARDFRTACTTTPFDGCRDPMWSRLQFDILYKF